MELNRSDLTNLKSLGVTESIKPITLSRTYKNGALGDAQMTIDQKVLAKVGYYVEGLAEGKQFAPVKAIALGAIFLPLALFGSKQNRTITYRLGGADTEVHTGA